MNENNLRESFPSSERIVIGARDTNTVERYQNTLTRYGKQSFGKSSGTWKSKKKSFLSLT
jgi:hypothetical protein